MYSILRESHPLRVIIWHQGKTRISNVSVKCEGHSFTDCRGMKSKNSYIAHVTIFWIKLRIYTTNFNELGQFAVRYRDIAFFIKKNSMQLDWDRDNSVLFTLLSQSSAVFCLDSSWASSPRCRVSPNDRPKLSQANTFQIWI